MIGEANLFICGRAWQLCGGGPSIAGGSFCDLTGQHRRLRFLSSLSAQGTLPLPRAIKTGSGASGIANNDSHRTSRWLRQLVSIYD